ncbi:MAG: hypothetical protein AB7V50_05490 [Vampirovibrionia bacterium]
MLPLSNVTSAGYVSAPTQKTVTKTSFNGIGPYHIPSVTCTGSKIGVNDKNTKVISNIDGDTFVKTGVSQDKAVKSSNSNFLGGLDYSSLINSSIFSLY